jgi:hypothetical protein
LQGVREADRGDRYLNNGIVQIRWRRTAIISVALVVMSVAIYAANFLYRPDEAAHLPKAEESPPKQPPVASMSLLPPEVRKALLSLCNPCSFADSNSPWNASDVIDGRLPRRRLTKTEKRGQDWLVQYESGGIGVLTYTAVFSLDPDIHLVKGSSCIPSQETCKW